MTGCTFFNIKFSAMEASNIFNRLFFCERCFFNGGPSGEDKCLIFDEVDSIYYIYLYEELNMFLIKPFVKGFTPHLVQLLTYSDESSVDYRMICSICGVEFKSNKNKSYSISLIEEKWFSHYTTPKKWKEILSKRF